MLLYQSWSSETLIASVLVRQTTIHDTIGRRREACAIGTHDMAHVVLESPSCGSAVRGDLQSLVIDALPPEEVMMIPLKVDEDAKLSQEGAQVIRAARPASEVIAAALANESRDGAATGARKYASMLAELPRVPVLLDATVRFCVQALNLNDRNRKRALTTVVLECCSQTQGTVLSLPPLTNALHTKVSVCVSVVSGSAILIPAVFNATGGPKHDIYTD